MVNVHAMAAPAAVAAASSVTVRVPMFGVAVPPAPSPLQLIVASTKPAGGGDSVRVVLTPAAASVCFAPDTPDPEVTVVMFWLAKPLLPVKPNVPTPPFDTLVTVIVGNIGGASEHTETLLLSSVTAPLSAKARPEMLAPVFNVTLELAIMVPGTLLDVFRVAELPTCQNTLQL